MLRYRSTRVRLHTSLPLALPEGILERLSFWKTSTSIILVGLVWLRFQRLGWIYWETVKNLN